MAKSKHKGGRKVRVAAGIRENLAELVDREVSDPRVRAAGICTINQVVLNSDMSIARVYISFFGATATDAVVAEAMVGLDAASGYLRGPLGRRMNLARTPQLRFVHDSSPEFNAKLAQIVADDTERAVDREADEERDDDD